MSRDPSRAVVRITRRGHILGAGVVLADGRVLTALSSLGHGHSLEVGLSYGASVPVAVAHTHRGWDLALLTPSEELTPGLLTAEHAATQDRRGGSVARVAELRLKFGAPGAPSHDVSLPSLDSAELAVVYGMDGVAIEHVQVPRRPVNHFGTPIVDGYGLLAGLVVRVCARQSADPCGAWQQVVLPGGIIDKFLRLAPTREILPPAWAGLRGEGVDTGVVRGVRINAVVPGSAAENARLSVGDVIVAVDERPVTTPLGLALALRGKSVGETLELLVFSDDSLLPRHIRVTTRQQTELLEPAHGPPERPASGL